MKHEEFIKKLNDLKDEAESAREDYLSCLEEQQKAKYTWAVIKAQIKKLRDDYSKFKNPNNK
jgi:chromosome segregation ATPase